MDRFIDMRLTFDVTNRNGNLNSLGIRNIMYINSLNLDFLEIQSKNSNDFDMFLILIVQLIWSYVIFFLYCEFGERVTNEFLELDNVVCQWEWYLLPLNVQRMLPNILLITQTPVILNGFGEFFCTRDAFRRVS